jgi:hypothetical protein
MRISVCLLLTATFVGAASNEAFSRDVKISGTHNASDIEKHCIDNGGTFFNGPGGGYGCAGHGGGTVTCTGKGKCTGTVSRVSGGGNNGGKGGVVNHPVQIIAPNKPIVAPNKPIAVAGPNGSNNPAKGGGTGASGMGGGGKIGGGSHEGRR